VIFAGVKARKFAMKVLALDHVQIAIPPGGEDRAREFYSGVLGLAEVPKPSSMAGRGGCWFAAGSLNLHLGVEEDFHPAKKAHPALVVEGLDELLARGEAAGAALKPDVSFGGFRRFHIFDPFGNRLELMEHIST